MRDAKKEGLEVNALSEKVVCFGQASQHPPFCSRHEIQEQFLYSYIFICFLILHTNTITVK